MNVYHTAKQYHFYHTSGLLILAPIALHLTASNWLKRSGLFMLSGIILISGRLYLLALTNIRWLGAITSPGGIAFIFARILLAVAVFKN